ncbi:MAG: plasmid pRiA4b ORF-3 family protein [Sphaerochaeta sp.]|nr:plasmid pRiA4b ORF-3 family protein [Sphaerochaeta sp.]
MYVQCTQKLLAKIKAPHGELTNPPDALFCWNANYFEHLGSLYVVMINGIDDEELMFEIESFEDFDKTVIAKIRLDLQDGGLPDKDIDTYIMLGGAVIFGPIQDKAKIALLSVYSKRMSHYFDRMQISMNVLDDPEIRERLQAVYTGDIDELASKKYFFSHQEPKETQKKSLEFVSPSMVALSVELKLFGDKKVRRRFLVPLHISFATLHTILQIGFGWYTCHLHEFRSSDRTLCVGPKSDFMGFDDDDEFTKDEEEVKLSDFIPRLKRMQYRYDLGDSWDHVIKVGKITPAEGVPYALCTGGVGSTPPEDCGGASGYANLCEILSDPNDEEYEEMLEWAGDDFAREFDQDAINKELGELTFVPFPTR